MIDWNTSSQGGEKTFLPATCHKHVEEPLFTYQLDLYLPVRK